MKVLICFKNIEICNVKLTTNPMVFVPSSITAIRGSLKPSLADIIPPGTNKLVRSLRANRTFQGSLNNFSVSPSNRQRKLINDNIFPE